MSDFWLFWMSERRYRAWLAARAEERAIRRARLILMTQDMLREMGYE